MRSPRRPNGHPAQRLAPRGGDPVVPVHTDGGHRAVPVEHQAGRDVAIDRRIDGGVLDQAGRTDRLLSGQPNGWSTPMTPPRSEIDVRKPWLTTGSDGRGVIASGVPAAAPGPRWSARTRRRRGLPRSPTKRTGSARVPTDRSRASPCIHETSVRSARTAADVHGSVPGCATRTARSGSPRSGNLWTGSHRSR